MASRPQRSCPNCDAPLEPDQQFCSSCGSPVPSSISGSNFTTQAPNSTYGSQTPPTQVPNNPYGSQTPPPPPQYVEQQSIYPSVPEYARTPQKKRSSWGKGCIITLLILAVILLLCGGAGYFGYQRIVAPSVTKALQSAQTTTSDSSSSADDDDGDNNTSTTITTTQLNLPAVTYASVDITVKNVQQANSFTDDNSYGQNGILRVNLLENNTGANNSSYFYNEVMFLVAPDGDSIKPIKSKDGYGPDSSIKRDNWVDFSVPTNNHPDQYSLRLGSSTENQISIPLKQGTNLDQYKPQTIQPNQKVSYAGTNWTLTKVSRQLSYAAKQADQGQVFIVTTFHIDNPSANSFYPFPSDILRLKTGDTQVSPYNQGLTGFSNIAAGQSNDVATCAFMVPAKGSDFTLKWLPDSLYQNSQETHTDFTVHHN